MKSTRLIYALAISLLLFNCSSDSTDDLREDDNGGDEGTNPEMTANITFDANIASIMNNHCTRCHGTTPTNGAPFPLVTFDQVRNRIDRVIVRTNSVSNPMPRAGLIAESLRDDIRKWRDDGLLEN